MLLSALKKSDDDNSIIMRMVEMEGTDKNIGLEFFIPVNHLLKTNLIEGDGLDTGQTGKELTIKIGKNSIETFKLDLEKK